VARPWVAVEDITELREGNKKPPGRDEGLPRGTTLLRNPVAGIAHLVLR
jgi:hypothetical protein